MKGLLIMAFDGITVAALTQELKNTLDGGRISKIAQPESDELNHDQDTTGTETLIYFCKCFSPTRLSDR